MKLLTDKCKTLTIATKTTTRTNISLEADDTDSESVENVDDIDEFIKNDKYLDLLFNVVKNEIKNE